MVGPKEGPIRRPTASQRTPNPPVGATRGLALGLRRLRTDGGTSVAQPMPQPRRLAWLEQPRFGRPRPSNAHRSRGLARWCSNLTAKHKFTSEKANATRA